MANKKEKIEKIKELVVERKVVIKESHDDLQKLTVDELDEKIAEIASLPIPPEGGNNGDEPPPPAPPDDDIGDVPIPVVGAELATLLPLLINIYNACGMPMPANNFEGWTIEHLREKVAELTPAYTKMQEILAFQRSEQQHLDVGKEVEIEDYIVWSRLRGTHILIADNVGGTPGANGEVVSKMIPGITVVFPPAMKNAWLSELYNPPPTVVTQYGSKGRIKTIIHNIISNKILTDPGSYKFLNKEEYTAMIQAEPMRDAVLERLEEALANPSLPESKEFFAQFKPKKTGVVVAGEVHVQDGHVKSL